MKCPICGCQRFYAKDPDDAYETYAFKCPGDKVIMDPGNEGDLEITSETESYCDRCTWHGKLADLKKE